MHAFASHLYVERCEALRRAVAEAELEHANTLLSALGIQEKTDHEESYYRKPLPVATRIALFIAKNR